MKIKDIDKLRKEDVFKPVFENLEKQYGSDIPEDLVEYVIELGIKSNHKVQNIIAWVDKTNSLIQSILSNARVESDYPLFWISIHEIIFALYDAENEQCKINELVGFKVPILQSLDKIKHSLTNDDLIFVKYMRHSHAHIFLDYLWHSVKVKDGNIIKVKKPYDPNTIDVANRITEENNNDQKLIAYKYAMKISEGVSELLSAVKNAI